MLLVSFLMDLMDLDRTSLTCNTEINLLETHLKYIPLTEECVSYRCLRFNTLHKLLRSPVRARVERTEAKRDAEVKWQLNASRSRPKKCKSSLSNQTPSTLRPAIPPQAGRVINIALAYTANRTTPPCAETRPVQHPAL